MTCIRKDNYGKAGESRDNAFPVYDMDFTPFGQSITLGKVIDHQDDKVANGYQSNDASVFERIETSKK